MRENNSCHTSKETIDLTLSHKHESFNINYRS